MRQVLFWIPPGFPVYGYGFMLFVAFIACLWLAKRLAARQDVPREAIENLGIGVFATGILGARVTYVTQEGIANFWQFFAIWDGGLVFYGSFIGGVFGYLLAYRLSLKKYGVSHWQMLDVIAPCAALGLALGRIGCLLNGCCYGQVACPDCAGITFPLSSAPRYVFVQRGLQTMAGFTVLEGTQTVGMVEPGSAAQAAGLKAGDEIHQVNETTVKKYGELKDALWDNWPRGRNDLKLVVLHADNRVQDLPIMYPRTIPLHPTQIYETISMTLLFLFLMAYYPLPRRDGALMVLFMIGYAVHRFLNEMLRTDTREVALGMTLSQNISVLLLVAALVLAVFVYRPRPRPTSAPAIAEGVPDAQG